MNEPTAGSIPAMSLLDSAATRLMAGDRVDVQNRFDGSWSGGFEIADVFGPPSHPTYRIRRLSDGAILPRLFEGAAVTGTRAPYAAPRPARTIPLNPPRQPALGLLAS